jgi:single-stranded DNA-binding protein
MNVCHLLGDVITDPILEELKDGRRICKFRLSTSNGKSHPPSRHFIVIWGRDANDEHPKNVHQYLRRGGKVQITGRISESRWQVKDNPTEWRSRTEIIVSNIQFITLGPYNNSQSSQGEVENALAE